LTTVADGHALAVGEVAAAAEETSTAAAKQAPSTVCANPLRPIPDTAEGLIVLLSVVITRPRLPASGNACYASPG
jgi:hypothetical protein